MTSTEQSSNTKNASTAVTSDIKKELFEVKNQLNENSFCWEMLKEQSRTNKRQHNVIMVLIAVIVAMFIGFLVYEAQFDTIDTTTDSIEQVLEAEQDGENNLVNGGDINYGTSESQN